MKTPLKLILAALLAFPSYQAAFAEEAPKPATPKVPLLLAETATVEKSDREKELEKQLQELRQTQLERELAELKASTKATEKSQSTMTGVFIGCGIALALLLIIGLAAG